MFIPINFDNSSSHWTRTLRVAQVDCLDSVSGFGDPKKEVNIITKEFLIQALYRYKFFGQAWTEVTKGHAASVFVVAVYPKMIAVEEY